MSNLDDLLEDTDDEVSYELSIVKTKKGKVYISTPELTIDGVDMTSQLLATLIVNWGHNLTEKLKTLEGFSVVSPILEVGLPK